ncbi:MAG: pantoate--beta-alanine ligase [Holosporaceae bacterium]|jgi:pantoate--beta-alanine ligase|nr:pantoate--beta-alanine ligase [Holosporaceae bacterium]
MIEVIATIGEVRKIVEGWKNENLGVGLVPTMGYLHAGHESLIRKAVEENDRVIVSVFVNPTQFAPNEDFDRYPRDLENDKKVCERAGADLIFHPTAEEMYPADFSTYVNVTKVSEELCGASRPGFFQGVATVVTKLFNITNADRAYFGQKDAQQLAVVRRFVRDLNMNVEIVACPIVREKDGLALSSRNAYLNAEERKAALVLSAALAKGKELLANGERDARKIESAMRRIIETEPLAKIDYVKIVDAKTIEPTADVKGTILCALAVFIGKTRLIDNFFLADAYKPE